MDHILSSTICPFCMIGRREERSTYGGFAIIKTDCPCCRDQILDSDTKEPLIPKVEPGDKSLSTLLLPNPRQNHMIYVNKFLKLSPFFKETNE